MRILCRGTCGFALLLLSLTHMAAAQTAPIPSPEAFFGFPMGAERQLAAWDRIVE